MAKKYAHCQTMCPCGNDLKFKIEKPTHFNPTIAKETCICETRIMLSGMIDKTSGDVALQFSLIHLSDIAKEILENDLRERKMATEK